MARLIDADKADVENICCYYGARCYVKDVQAWLDEQPTVDAVPVVRCKDCRFFNDRGFCTRVAGLTRIKPDDYCSYGAKMDLEVE